MAVKVYLGGAPAAHSEMTYQDADTFSVTAGGFLTAMPVRLRSARRARGGRVLPSAVVLSPETAGGRVPLPRRQPRRGHL